MSQAVTPAAPTMTADQPHFGRWTVLSKMANRSFCRCECGTEKWVVTSSVKSAASRSCGCLRREVVSAQNRVHGESHQNETREHCSWRAMMGRCYSPNSERYPHYGGRGIVVCERWRLSYLDFLADMGRCPSHCSSIGRSDVNGNYEPGNTEWQTDHQQARERTDNHVVEWRGRMMILTDAASDAGLAYKTVQMRITRGGWSVERALSTPARPISSKGCSKRKIERESNRAASYPANLGTTALSDRESLASPR